MLTKFVGFYEKRITRAGKYDVVCNTYLPGTSTRKKRGSEIRNKVGSQVKIPTNLKAFLRDSQIRRKYLIFSLMR